MWLSLAAAASATINSRHPFVEYIVYELCADCVSIGRASELAHIAHTDVFILFLVAFDRVSSDRWHTHTEHRTMYIVYTANDCRDETQFEFQMQISYIFIFYPSQEICSISKHLVSACRYRCLCLYRF